MIRNNPEADCGRISRRSLSGMLLGGSTAMLASMASTAAQNPLPATSSVPSGGTVEDHLAIQQLIYKYGLALDSLDKVALFDCFASHSPLRPMLEAGFESHRQYEHTMHQMLNHLYTVRGDVAKGVTYAVASMIKRTGSGLTKFDNYFFYHDELVKEDLRWLFFKRELSLVFSSEPTHVHPGAPFLGSQITPGSFRKPPILDYLKP